MKPVIASGRHIAIVVPAFNEGSNITALHQAICQAVVNQPDRFSMIYVNDGSTDGSPALLDQLADSERNVIVLHLSRNFGHQAALSAGLDEAGAMQVDAVITMDADMQHPPSMIPELLAQWHQGYEVVYTIRDASHAAPWFKRATSRIFYRLTAVLTDTPVPQGAADFRLISRAALHALLSLPERAPVLRSLSTWVGFRQIGIHYTPAPRFRGVSHYSLGRMYGLALDTLVSSSTRPLSFVISCGLCISAAAGLYLLWIVYAHFFTDRTLPGWSSVMAATILLGGVNLCVVGIIGVYVAKVFEEVKHRPLYVVQARKGKSDDSPRT
jgi:glycosyltransferase involved in cell wall biosynthesis